MDACDSSFSASPASGRPSSIVRWGIVGCGSVCEVKSGPGFQKAAGSELVAVMRRDRAKAEDFAARHGVPSCTPRRTRSLPIPGVDAVYVATPPDSHADWRSVSPRRQALPRRKAHGAHARRVPARWFEAFETRRRAAVGRLLSSRAAPLPADPPAHRGAAPSAGSPRCTSTSRVRSRRATCSRTGGSSRISPAGGCSSTSRRTRSISLDFLAGPISRVAGSAANTGGAYAAEDVTTAAFQFDTRRGRHGRWNFNAGETTDRLTLAGTTGEITTRGLRRHRRHRDARRPDGGARSPQPSARAPAAHPDDRGRVARAGHASRPASVARALRGCSIDAWRITTRSTGARVDMVQVGLRWSLCRIPEQA